MPDGPQPVRFGIFEVDLAASELRRNGVRVKLQEQPFQVLAALLERPGEVVTKEELQERIWKEDTFVDFDRSLATAVNKIRQALGDSAAQPRFIETVPKRGYRFIDTNAPEGRSSAQRKKSRLLLALGVGALALAGMAALVFGVSGRDGASSDAPLSALPLTSYPGLELSPALSPDGSQVAFVWNGEDQDKFDIYVQEARVGSPPVRLTFDSKNDFSPAWSPDGRYLAFLRGYPGRSEILRIPSIGGSAKKLGELAFRKTSIPSLTLSFKFLDWSPDGRFLAIAYREDGSSSPVHQLEVATGERTAFPNPDLSNAGDPAYAPDGRSLAYNGWRTAGNSDVWLQDLDESGMPIGEPRRLALDAGWMFGLDWTADGREIVFSSDVQGTRRFQRVAIEGGPPEIVQVGGGAGPKLSIAPHASRLAYERSQGDSDLWSFPGPLARSAAGMAPKRLAPSTRADHSVHFSPDGERIVFVSYRTGHAELWVSMADGSDARRLTSLNGPFAGSPRWSWDGRFIAFDGNQAGPWEIYVIRADGGEARRVTKSKSVDIRPTWSRDGAWIYFLSGRSGKGALWRARTDGGEAVQVTQDGGADSYEAADGSLYFHRDVEGNGEIWRLVRGAKGPERVLGGVEPKQWAVFDGGVCFVRASEGEPAGLWFYDLVTGRTERFAEVPEGVRIDGSPGLSVSPDGGQVVVGLAATGSDIMLVEDFR